MPELAQLTLTPGSVGRDIFLLEESDGALNRDVSFSEVRRIQRNFDPNVARYTPLKAWRAPDGKLRLIDGQHRALAVSTSGDLNATFDVLIYNADEVSAGQDVALVLQASNNGRTLRSSDYLKISAPYSPWPAALHGVDVRHGLGAGHYTYSGVIFGYLFAKHVIALERFPVGLPLKTRDISARWVAPLPEDVEAFRESLLWWAPVAQAAYLGPGRSNSLYTTAGVSFGYLLYSQVPDRELLEQARTRLISSESLSFIRVMGGAGIFRAYNELLRLANYRASTRRIVLFGKDGRE